MSSIRKSQLLTLLCWLPPLGLFGIYHAYLHQYTQLTTHLLAPLWTIPHWLYDISSLREYVNRFNYKQKYMNMTTQQHNNNNNNNNNTYTYNVYNRSASDSQIYNNIVASHINQQHHHHINNNNNTNNNNNNNNIYNHMPRYTFAEANKYWSTFGLLGAHWLYFHNIPLALLYFCTFGLCGIGWLLDGYYLQALVLYANQFYYRNNHRYNNNNNNTFHAPNLYVLDNIHAVTRHFHNNISSTHNNRNNNNNNNNNVDELTSLHNTLLRIWWPLGIFSYSLLFTSIYARYAIYIDIRYIWYRLVI